MNCDHDAPDMITTMLTFWSNFDEAQDFFYDKLPNYCEFTWIFKSVKPNFNIVSLTAILQYPDYAIDDFNYQVIGQLPPHNATRIDDDTYLKYRRLENDHPGIVTIVNKGYYSFGYGIDLRCNETINISSEEEETTALSESDQDTDFSSYDETPSDTELETTESL